MKKTLFSRYTLYPNFHKTHPIRTQTGDKFVIYVHIRRYGYFNTLQYPVHPSATPHGVLGYFRVLKYPYLRT